MVLRAHRVGVKPALPVPGGRLTEVRIESAPAASVVGQAEPVGRAAEPTAEQPESAAVDVMKQQNLR